MKDKRQTEASPQVSPLKMPMPEDVRALLSQQEEAEDQVVVSTDTDLDVAGVYAEHWVIVTRDRVLVAKRNGGIAELRRELPISAIQTARIDSRVGSGFLEAKTNDVYVELARFSNRHAEKFAKVAIKIKNLVEGKPVELGREKEEWQTGRCQKCGAPVLDRRMAICPKCLKRGLVFMRFLAYTKGYWPYTLAAMALVLFTIMISLFPPLLLEVLIDNVFGTKEGLPKWFNTISGIFHLTTKMQWLYVLVGSLAATTLAGVLIGWLRERLAVYINNRLGFDLRRDVFGKLQDMAVSYYDKYPVGQLMTRCSQDVEALQGFINQLTGGFGFQILFVIAVGASMFTMSWKMALIAILPAPVVMICTVMFYKHIVPRWSKFWTTRSDMSNILHAALSGIRVVKAFAQEDREEERFKRYSMRYCDSGYKVGYSSAIFYPIMGFVFQLGSYFVWLYGGYVILRGVNTDLTTGALIAFLNYLGMFYGPLNSLTQMSNWFTSFTTQAHRVFEVLDREPEITEPKDAVEIEIRGAIAFNSVSFGYDRHIPVLHDVSFEIQPGEMVGIVGHSGSGKSTTVNLITRFYDPVDGTVTIDNVDLRRIRKRCLRRQIGIVLQDPFLFRGSIADNIAYGNPEVAPEQILDSALAANAHMFITRAHDGYDTRLGEIGSGLSGGERQRVAIARALLHNPRVLILDEATSSVDTIAEREIQKALDALSLGRTVIAIAHRLSTLRNCDRIIVFEEGHIREQGSHEELMAKKGIYHKLVEIQTQLTSDREASVDGLKALDDLEEAQKAVEKVEEAKAPTAQKNIERSRGEVPRIRYLDPKTLRAEVMDDGAMRISIPAAGGGDPEVHEHVRAYRCFPISRPGEFVALWTGSSALEHKQVGVIRRMKEMPAATRHIVEHELAKRYFVHVIETIHGIKEDLGFLTWRVNTDKGALEFMTQRWDRSTVIDGAPNGKIIFDIDNNRYEIEDLHSLDPESRAVFLKYIYW